MVGIWVVEPADHLVANEDSAAVVKQHHLSHEHVLVHHHFLYIYYNLDHS